MEVYRAGIFLWLQGMKSFDIAQAGVFARRRSLGGVERRVWFRGFHGIRTSLYFYMPAPPSNASCIRITTFIVANPASSPPPPLRAGVLAQAPETRVLCCRQFLVMNKKLFAPALDLRHRSSLADHERVRTGNENWRTYFR
jgi:hypothetical protein